MSCWSAPRTATVGTCLGQNNGNRPTNRQEHPYARRWFHQAGASPSDRICRGSAPLRGRTAVSYERRRRAIRRELDRATVDQQREHRSPTLLSVTQRTGAMSSTFEGVMAIVREALRGEGSSPVRPTNRMLLPSRTLGRPRGGTR